MADSDREQILRLLRGQENAIADGNAKEVVAPLADDVVIYDLPPPLQSSGPAARDTAALDAWFDTWEDGVRVELAKPNVLINDDLAVVFGLSQMRGRKKAEADLDNWFRRTVVLQRRDEKWQIVHEHNSFPMAMDGNGKALTDLQP